MTAKEYLKENDIWSTTLEDLKIVDVSGHKFSVDYLMEQYANEKVKEETEKDKEFAFDLWTQCVDKNERIQELEEGLRDIADIEKDRMKYPKQSRAYIIAESLLH